MKNKTVYILLVFITIAMAAAAALILNVIKDRPEPVLAIQEDVPEAQAPQLEEKSFLYNGSTVSERSIAFNDGGIFRILRFDFAEDASFLEFEIPVAGDDISIKWQNYDVSPYSWEYVDSDLPKATLFAETTKESIVLSIPAIYHNRFDFNTMEAIPELEKPAKIEKTDNGYVFRMEFEPSGSSIGELWYYKCPGVLTEWRDEQELLWIRQDLYKNRRFCFDGYYYKTYESYRPYAENGFFRNSANFTGAQILNSNGSAKNLGYAMTKICLLNQNPYGYWETGPMSEWLYNDYGIGYNFYDTRFSTDFARSLLNAYSLFGGADLLNGAVKYAEYLVGYAQQEGYTGGRLGEGILVPDYWSRSQTKKPHVSLNHQLAEINFLLETFMVTGEQRYRELALRMLNGIENTGKDWIMDDKNLRYALMYEDSTNNMTDYPYLTYNDLFETKQLLEKLNEKSGTIEALMSSKKEWMDENGITGYKE